MDQLPDSLKYSQVEAEMFRYSTELLATQSDGTAISFILDSQRVLNTVAQEMAGLLNVEGCVIFEWSQAANSLAIIAEHHLDEADTTFLRQTFSLADRPLSRQVLEHRQHRQVTLDLAEVDGPDRIFLREAGVRVLLMVPMVFQQQVVGLVRLMSRQKQFFSEQEVGLAQLLANQAASTIENARLYNEVHQRIDELAVLSTINQTINSTLDLQEILNIITDLARRLIGVAATSVVLDNEEGGDLYYAASSGAGATFVRGKRLAAGQGIMGWVVEHGQPAFVPDVSKDPRFLPKFDQKSGFLTLSMLCVPLMAKGRTTGAIGLMNKEQGNFDQDDLRLLNLLAASAAVAIENARLYRRAQQELLERMRAKEALQESIQKSKLAYDQLTIYAQELTEEIVERKRVQAELAEERSLLARRVEERTAALKAANVELETSLYLNRKFSQAFAQHLEALEILHDTGLRLMHSLDTDTVLNLISQTVLDLIPEAAGSMIHFVSDEEEQLLPIVFSAEDSTKMVYPTLGIDPIVRQALDNNETIYIPDILTYTGNLEPKLTDMRAVLVIPLIEQEPLGTLGVYSAEPDIFSNEHQYILSILANQASVAINKARFIKEREIAKEREKQNIRNLFQRYVSPAVVERLVDGRENLILGGQRQDVAVLFADIRGFTSFGENIAPEELVEHLNQYLALAVDAILTEEGTLDKFMGDAVMALFNAPLFQPESTLKAVRAALAMQQAIAGYNAKRASLHSLSFGIGIHFGPAVVGNIGTPQQMNYTAIGDTVNLAKRLQENADGGEILLSHTAYQQVHHAVFVDELGPLVVKGRAAPVNTYKLRGLS
jgi:class 3 adenylate cyclase